MKLLMTSRWHWKIRSKPVTSWISHQLRTRPTFSHPLPILSREIHLFYLFRLASLINRPIMELHRRSFHIDDGETLDLPDVKPAKHYFNLWSRGRRGCTLKVAKPENLGPRRSSRHPQADFGAFKSLCAPFSNPNLHNHHR